MTGPTGPTDEIASSAPSSEPAPLHEEARIEGSARARLANAALLALSRAARSFLLYDPGNAAVRRFIEDLRNKMTQALGGEPLRLEVRPFELVLDGEVVYLERDREHSLAFRMYRDGVRRLTLGGALDWDELLRLLEVLSVRYTGVRQNEDDIVTLLWKAGFQHIEIEAVEGFAPEEGDVPTRHGQRAQGVQAPDDWDLPARVLSSRQEPDWRPVADADREALCGEEASHLLPANAAHCALTLLERASDPADPIALEDVVPFVAEVRDFLLAEGQLGHVTILVRALLAHEEEDPERLGPLVASFGDRRALSQILHSTPKAVTAPPLELVELLDLLPTHRYARLLDLLRTERGEAPRRLIRQLIERYAHEAPEQLLAALKGAEPGVACDLLRALAGCLPERALEASLELALHPDVSVVSEAFRRLEEAQPSPRLARTLLHMLDSPLEEMHLRVLDLLGRRYSASVFESLVRSTETRCAAHALSEREAEALGRTLARLAPAQAFPLFEQWLRPRKLIARLVETQGRWLHEWVAISGLGALRAEQAETLIRETSTRVSTVFAVVIASQPWLAAATWTNAMDEIATAQEQLGRALTRARAGEDKALAGRVRDEGDRLVKLLHGLLEMARLHALENRAFDQPVKDFAGALAILVELLGAVHLLAVEDQLYVNDIRIRLENSDVGRLLGEHLGQIGLGGFTFHARLAEPQVRDFAALLSHALKEGADRAAVEQALAAAGLSDVQLMGIQRFRLAGEAEAPSQRDAAATVLRGEELIDEALENLGANRMPNPLPLRRVVTELLQSGASERLIETEDESSPYAAHTLRVCNLALLLGHAVGLSSGALQDLGVAALFHDVGYASGPREGEAQTSGVSASAFERHPVAAVRLLLRQRGFHEAKIRRLMAALDHHRRYDDSRGVPSLFGRILALAEDYDTLTRPPLGRSPYDALAAMAAEGGTVYDPTLVQLFVNLLGRFPPQTRVQLSDGRLATVLSLARGQAGFERPVVRIQRRADGSLEAPDTLVDLLEERGLSIRGVAGAVAPAAAAAAAASRAAAPAAAVPHAAVPHAAMPKPAPSSPAAPAPIHRGPSENARSLDEGGLPAILGDLFLGQKSGVLHLLRGVEHRGIRIVAGNVIHASSNQPSDYREEAAAREGEDGLAQRALAVIRRAFDWRDGWWEFEPLDPALPFFGSLTDHLSTADLILEAVRHIEDPDILLFHLGDLDHRPRLSRHPQVKTLKVALTPLDGFVLSRIDGQLSLRDILTIVPGDRAALLRSLFGLLCIGLLER